MTDYTVRYSGRDTGVLRTEIMKATDLAVVQDQVRRRLEASRAFAEACVFEAGAPRFRLASGRLGVREAL